MHPSYLTLTPSPQLYSLATIYPTHMLRIITPGASYMPQKSLLILRTDQQY